MKPRILFVDDESHVLESLADVWGYDYDVATAADGASGLAMIAAWNPAVIVSDMRMPAWMARPSSPRPERLRRRRSACSSPARPTSRPPVAPSTWVGSSSS